jgi:MGT family glycosyltransferase
MPDITFVAPPFLGHLTQILALAENLAARGHVVHVVTSHTRAREVYEAGAKLIPWEIGDDDKALTAVWRHATRAQAWAGERVMLSYLVERYDSIYESLRKLLLARRGDIFVFDRALIPAMDLAFSEGMPFLILSRGLAIVHDASWKYPLPYSSMPYPMTRLQKIVNLALRAWHMSAFFAPLMKLLAKRRVKNRALGAYNPFKAAPVIVGNAPLLELNQPVPGNIKLVGPILAKRDKTAGAELTRWLDARSNVVYVTFGTLAILTESQLESWCLGLLQTGFHILWALPGQNFDLLKDVILPRLSKEDQSRLRVERFVPQRQVLEHSSVSAFVTHASANGVMEALIAGKPMVAAPLFGDQCYFAARVQELGVGVRINKTQITEAVIRSTVRRVVETPSYAEAALAARTVLRQLDGLGEATRLIEAALTTNGQGLAAAPAGIFLKP